MNNILKNLIRIGRVSAVDPAKATARVVFEAHDLVSYDLPILQRQTMKNKDYWLPDVGEHVICIFLPTGNAEGFILGAIYSKEDQPLVTSPDKRAIFFEDGSFIEYDRASHILTINVKGPVNIVASGNVNVSGDVVADGISLKNHIHPENDLGGPTGPPLK
jgi:phage baseplate assembly protein V